VVGDRKRFLGWRIVDRVLRTTEFEEKTMQGVTVVDHPLVQHKLTIMRKKETSTAGFRRLLREISLLLGYEVTRNLELTTTTIETPIETMEAPTLEGKKLVFASVLRAGNGLLEGLLDLVPAARVAHIGLYRDHETLEAVEYFFKAPSDLADRLVIVVDPMLATANSAIAAIDKLKGRGATNIRFLCLLAAPEGIARFTKAHPDVPVFTASIDRQLNDKGYIMPGLGDAGDRMYGTK
jgi:uracil phosphoribosyltransferase